MRLLLDAHVSGRVVGRRLEAGGHDVRALEQEPTLEGLDDRMVLALATQEQRILVTHDTSDFPRVLRDESGRSHAGVILIYGIGHHEFEAIVRGVERWLERRPTSADWLDFPAVIDRRWAAGQHGSSTPVRH